LIRLKIIPALKRWGIPPGRAKKESKMKSGINHILIEIKEIKKVLERSENLFYHEKRFYEGKLAGLNLCLRFLGYSDK